MTDSRPRVLSTVLLRDLEPPGDIGVFVTGDILFCVPLLDLLPTEVDSALGDIGCDLYSMGSPISTLPVVLLRDLLPTGPSTVFDSWRSNGGFLLRLSFSPAHKIKSEVKRACITIGLCKAPSSNYARWRNLSIAMAVYGN